MSDDSTPTATTPAPTTEHRTFGTILLGMLERSAVWSFHELAKPAVRTVVVGIILIIVGVFAIDHSVWTFPLVVIGALMIIAAWVGTRLEGRFGVEWSDGGAQFELRAGFRPRDPSLRGPSSSSTPIAPLTPVVSPVSTASSPTSAVTRAESQADVIEGQAHTIEIDVDELKALVAAAERGGVHTAAATSATTNGTPVTWQETAPRQDPGVDETYN